MDNAVKFTRTKEKATIEIGSRQDPDGGEIWAEAQLNEGATFYFTLRKWMEG